jgi:hypothetical protein
MAHRSPAARCWSLGAASTLVVTTQGQGGPNFPSCWDGENIDSANHRAHIQFPDRATGACPAGTVAVPQLRISISYDIAVQVQQRGQYQLDSFPEENHNPTSDHNDFLNVNSTRQMAKIVNCVNSGLRCR